MAKKKKPSLTVRNSDDSSHTSISKNPNLQVLLDVFPMKRNRGRRGGEKTVLKKLTSPKKRKKKKILHYTRVLSRFSYTTSALYIFPQGRQVGRAGRAGSVEYIGRFQIDCLLFHRQDIPKKKKNLTFETKKKNSGNRAQHQGGREIQT